MNTILITGANRGLGLEFARQYTADGWRVLACCRQPDRADQLQQIAASAPDRVKLHALDVSDLGRIDELARELNGVAIDVLLNNAGVYGPTKVTLGSIDYEAWKEVFLVNTLAPCKLTEALVENVAASQRKLVACVSSQMGSIAKNTEGKHYLYRSTKAALNMVVKCLAVDLAERGVTVVTLHPGWVRTDMGGAEADLSPEESVSSLRAVLGRVTFADSGKFLNYDGSPIPW